MSSDGPTIAWNPAFRPNSDSEADAITPRPGVDEDGQIAAQTRDIPAYKSNAPKELDLSPNKVEETATDDDGMSNWFADDEPGSPPVIPDVAPEAEGVRDQGHESAAPPTDNQGDDFDETRYVHTEDRHAEEPEASLDATEHDDDLAFNTTMTSIQAKHASTISFARTVSHDVTLAGEDDDSEWTLPRTDTDPFKFMPPNDRTNSFPPVPPLQEPSVPQENEQSSIQAQPERHIRDVAPGGQAADDDFFASAAQPLQSEELVEEEGWASGNGSQQFVGGDVQDVTAESSEARYTEGVPLISHEINGDLNGDAPDPFAEDAGGDDDFFNQIEDAQPAQSHIPDPIVEQPLQRKSTAQVLGSIVPDTTARRDTGLENTLEEEEAVGERWPSGIGGNGDEDAGDDFFTQLKGDTPDLSVEVETGNLDVLVPTDTSIEEVQKGSNVTEEEWPSDLGAADEGEAVDATQASSTASGAPKGGADLETKWAAVFGDDEDDGFLDDGTAETKAPAMDPSAFFGDDDEGFLDDAELPAPAVQSQEQPALPPVAQPQTVANPYLPAGHPQAGTAQTQPPSNPYLPTAISTAPQAPPNTPYSVPSTAPLPHVGPSYGAFNPPPQPPPDQARATSFADKARSGYSSPYDLPMEVVRPRKRQSMQQLPRATAATAPPPRSSSMQVPPPPLAGTTPPGSSHGPPGAGKSVPSPLKKAPESFFEDLPVSSKPRSASRQSQKGVLSPQASPYGPPSTTHGPPQLSPLGQQVQPGLSPQHAPVPPQVPQQAPATSQQTPPAMTSRYAPAPASTSQCAPVRPTAPPAPAAGPDMANLVAPPRVGPYAPVHSNSLPPPSTLPAANAASKYSAAPATAPQSGNAIPPALSNRYSPSPGSNRAASAGYAPSPANGPPVILPHQPRTSSPLAHFEVSHDATKAPERRTSSALYGLQRIPSLPQVEEEETAGQTRSFGGPPPPQATQPPPRPRQTPPPSNAYPQATLSPPKRVSGYGPVPHAALSSQGQDFVPPQRSQTQSPGALLGNRPGLKSIDPIPRPSSVNDPTSPRLAAPMMGTIPSLAQAPAQASPQKQSLRPRGFSQNLNFITPTDGRQHDQLQRWRGAPLISWGVGGTLITSFPKDVPRYGMNQTMPMIIRSPGEIKVKNIRDVDPWEERLAKFPGPLKGKSKKKETLAWLSTGIEGLENSLPNLSFQQSPSHEDTRAIERVLLWKILRTFIEFDGALEGNDAVNKAVREVLSPGLAGVDVSSGGFRAGAAGSGPAGFQTLSAPQMQADGVDSSTVEQIRKNLMTGDRERAVWDAADKRLWGHALLIASTTSPDLYKKVAQEFVRKEVNCPGHNNESLAVLYEVLSGNHEECVDELVPVHARAGLQLMNTTAAASQTKDALAGLDKWQETLTLILSNRSADDVQALNSLGNLLSGYGRAEAAHVCFLFARNATVFGGLDDPRSNFVLLGADHRRQADQFAKETEALLLSEVYEYGLSLAPGSNVAVSSPHLAAYKLQHAMTLAEYGHRDKALQYCEAIMNAIRAQTRRSPYHHTILETSVEDLEKRLRQAPKEGTNSWMTKPSMNKVSDSMWNRFNKFVAGDENDGANPGSDGEAGFESGPFARLAGGTPTISRPPSASGATGMEMFGPQSVPNSVPPMMNGGMAPQPATRAASRYAPMAGQPAAAVPNPYEPGAVYSPARSSMEHNSGEYNRASYEQQRQSAELQNKYSPGFALSSAGPSPAYPGSALGIAQELPAVPSPQQQQPAMPGYQPYTPHEPGMNGSAFTTFAQQPVGALKPKETPVEEEQPVNYGYQPPSCGSEPPSYGYQPPTMNTPAEDPASVTEQSQPTAEETQLGGGGYEPPTTQSYGYEPPSYSYNPGTEADDDVEAPKPNKKSFMGDDDDDIPAPKAEPVEKSKAEKDREHDELFRKAAEEDAKRAEAEKAAKAKKGWGFGGWFGGSKAAASASSGLDSSAPNKPIRAKLGEKSSFVFDPELKRWINKNASPDEAAKAATPTPPPPRSTPRSAAATPPPMGAKMAPPPSLNPSLSVPNLQAAADGASDGKAGPAAMLRSASNTSAASGPPSRPQTSMSNASSIDDLLGAAGSRKPAGKKARKSGRYVDVMANN